MKPVLFLLLALQTACTPTTLKEPLTDYGTADLSYLVLTQKALTYQADFDTEAWGEMLTDSIEFIAPDGQPVWRGKPAVLAGWQQWRQQLGVARMQLTNLTHWPIQIAQPSALWHKPGVYVVSYCTAHLSLRDGQQTHLLMHLCCHFDTTGHIDRYLLLHQQPLNKATTRKPASDFKKPYLF
ncbi:nuclear transport factor 2 family protein [Larkinella punicea]|uniref:Nuclear transport factor 2 family protein n=1 Tax=Larkinella punicea TaxID=2315727 RepID=A0A368JJR5_9BACT|nr:nuclear transport factor 2 family protein [Larkinella punicea]RCR67900.1 hypothetical protein DUE52_19440 [Larkinella punicea]